MRRLCGKCVAGLIVCRGNGGGISLGELVSDGGDGLFETSEACVDVVG